MKSNAKNNKATQQRCYEMLLYRQKNLVVGQNDRLKESPTHAGTSSASERAYSNKSQLIRKCRKPKQRATTIALFYLLLKYNTKLAIKKEASRRITSHLHHHKRERKTLKRQLTRERKTHKSNTINTNNNVIIRS